MANSNFGDEVWKIIFKLKKMGEKYNLSGQIIRALRADN